MNKSPLNKHKHVTLIGMMGSGKTTVGRLLAHALKRHFQDCDALLSAHTNLSIEQLFASEGERSFRKREQELLAGILMTALPSVVATGGGAILLARNRKLLAEYSYCVFLQAPVEVLISRVKAQHASAQRPLIKNTDITSRMTQLLSERTPLYTSTADYVMPVETHTPQQTADALVAHYQQQNQQPSQVPRQ